MILRCSDGIASCWASLFWDILHFLNEISGMRIIEKKYVKTIDRKRLFDIITVMIPDL